MRLAERDAPRLYRFPRPALRAGIFDSRVTEYVRVPPDHLVDDRPHDIREPESAGSDPILCVEDHLEEQIAQFVHECGVVRGAQWRPPLRAPPRWCGGYGVEGLHEVRDNLDPGLAASPSTLCSSSIVATGRRLESGSLSSPHSSSPLTPSGTSAFRTKQGESIDLTEPCPVGCASFRHSRRLVNQSLHNWCRLRSASGVFSTRPGACPAFVTGIGKAENLDSGAAPMHPRAGRQASPHCLEEVFHVSPGTLRYAATAAILGGGNAACRPGPQHTDLTVVNWAARPPGSHARAGAPFEERYGLTVNMEHYGGPERRPKTRWKRPTSSGTWWTSSTPT